VLLGSGLLLLARVGEDPSWVTDVLPGAIVMGIGLVTFVAPLTETVMASVNAERVSTASGVNNAVARTAGLAALAVIPVVAGLTDAAGPGGTTHAFRTAMVIAAVLAAVAAPVSWFGLRRDSDARRSARRVHCAIDGPPLQLDPSRR
jgi:MFS family permease